VCDTLQREGVPFLVIEERRDLADQLRARGVDVIHGHVPAADVINAANLAAARRLFIAIPDGFEAGQIAEQARAINAGLHIIARAHSDAEAEHLGKHGADIAIVGERELARAMLTQAFADREPRETTTGGAPDATADDEGATARVGTSGE
jgi:CPA2 family monovalent cation:H+ antiporter-2